MSSRADESNTQWLMAVMGLFYGLAIISVGLRMYARFIVVKSPGLDDFFMIVAALCATVGIATHAVQSQNGLGRHYEFITAAEMVEYQKYGFFQSVIANTGGVSILKISIALSLLKLVSASNRPYTYTLYGFLGLTTATAIYAWCTIIFFCDPIRGYWDKTTQPKCYDIKLFVIFGLVHTAINIFTDVAFAMLPIPIIWMLQMKKRTKVYLCIVLSLGLVAVAMGAVKAKYQIQHSGDKDRYFMHGVQFWAFLQLNTGIIAACAPMLKPLVGRALKLGSTSPAKSYGYGPSGLRTYGSGGGARGPLARSKRGYINQTETYDDCEVQMDAFRGPGAATCEAGAVGGAYVAKQAYQQKRPDGKDVSAIGIAKSTSTDDTASDDLILQGNVAEGQILRTTEISVQR